MSSITERTDAIFAEWNQPASPGCALAVIRDGEIIYQRGYGLADLERGTSISPKSLFDIGSTGKQFTATIIAILENQGLLSRGDSLRTYVPEVPAYADAITLGHLIHHTSGLRDYLELMALADMPEENLYHESQLLDLITRQKELNFPPGNEYLYSNSGYFLLGIIAQRVTGNHLTDLIREQIYAPLGMTHSTFNKDHRPLALNRALSYTQNEDGSFANEISLCGGSGDGPVYSSIEDLFLWDQNFYHNQLNDSQPNLLDKLHTQGQLNNGETIPYAYGLFIEDYRGLKSVSHGGSWAGYASELLRFPDQRFSVICLCNLASMDPEELSRRVADIYLEADFTKPIPLKEKEPQKDNPVFSPEALDRFTGEYPSEELATKYILSAQNGQLFLQRSRFTPPEPLKPIAPETFKAKELELRFDNNTLTLTAGRVQNIRLEKA